MSLNNLNSRGMQKRIRDYFRGCIDFSGYDSAPDETAPDNVRLRFLWDVFKSEYFYPDNLKRYGSYQKVFEQWLMGVPSVFNTPFMYADIIETAKNLEWLTGDITEKEEDRVIGQWFSFVAFNMFKWMNAEGVHRDN